MAYSYWTRTLVVMTALVIQWLVDVETTGVGKSPDRSPLVIAHRGASGVLPEHTAAAYRQAIEDGADYIECDVTLTRDLVPVCLHENWLTQTTDVASRPEFANRSRTLVAGGTSIKDDWFAIDFTLEELKVLRKVQPSSFRDQSFNGKFPIATFEEHLSIVRNSSRIVGTYPEVKDPEWINSLDIMNGTRIEDIVLKTLAKYGFTNRDDPCFIQSFSEDSLNYIANITQLRLIMLTENPFPESKLETWSRRGFYGVGPWFDQITPVWTETNGFKNWINTTTDLVDQCHRRNLTVHAYTFRNEDRFLPWNFHQDINNAYDHYYTKLGVDGFFTDFPETLVRFRNNLNRPDKREKLPTAPTTISSGSTRTIQVVWFPVVFCMILFQTSTAVNLLGIQL